MLTIGHVLVRGFSWEFARIYAKFHPKILKNEKACGVLRKPHYGKMVNRVMTNFVHFWQFFWSIIYNSTDIIKPCIGFYIWSRPTLYMKLISSKYIFCSQKRVSQTSLPNRSKKFHVPVSSNHRSCQWSNGCFTLVWWRQVEKILAILLFVVAAFLKHIFSWTWEKLTSMERLIGEGRSKFHTFDYLTCTNSNVRMDIILHIRFLTESKNFGLSWGFMMIWFAVTLVV